MKASADQTAQATDEIGPQIGQVLERRGPGGFGDRRDRGPHLGNQRRGGLDRGGCREQDAAPQEIVRNVGQAASCTSEVTCTITAVAEPAEATGTAANAVLASASNLSRRSDRLSAEVRGFLAAVRAA